jgi:type II secretory pathway pseudopilin PulG
VKRFRIQSEEGITIVELTIASFVIGIIGALMLTLFMLVDRAQQRTEANTESLTNLKISRERIEREVRQADRIEDDSTYSSLHLWVDDNGDEVVDLEEDIVWSFETDPAGGFRLVRTDGNGVRTIAGGGMIDPTTSGYLPFSDGGAVPSSSTQIISITFAAQGEDGDLQQVETQVRLRNR